MENVLRNPNVKRTDLSLLAPCLEEAFNRTHRPTAQPLGAIVQPSGKPFATKMFHGDIDTAKFADDSEKSLKLAVSPKAAKPAPIDQVFLSTKAAASHVVETAVSGNRQRCGFGPN